MQGKEVDLIEHTLEQMRNHPELKIYIGTDSQDDGADTVYATAVLYRYENKGAHFIYFREKVPRIWDMFTRLYSEGQRTIETAELILKEIAHAHFEALEFDYADVKKTMSTRVISALKGWVKGMGLKPSFKSGEQLATKASDQICRKTELYL